MRMCRLLRLLTFLIMATPANEESSIQWLRSVTFVVLSLLVGSMVTMRVTVSFELSTTSIK
jgi:heme/copper-type cytochrome/quinol oxidase subunit 4